jgi:hypothetical protein
MVITETVDISSGEWEGRKRDSVFQRTMFDWTLWPWPPAAQTVSSCDCRQGSFPIWEL